ncbi:hypothetical protein D7S89_18860 [Trinickia fusca]|uniref:Uncharacterized protein n=1 Tax=Trinickia fusca TaxID=2419777 RepID=A0A494X8U5_9BURK|nr:hypothetical protein D7S89_18860 [Trinickia fusca]
MAEKANVRWEIRLFDEARIPTRKGYVFFCSGTSYLCYPSESVDVCPDCLESAIVAVRQYVRKKPPRVLYVRCCRTVHTALALEPVSEGLVTV